MSSIITLKTTGAYVIKNLIELLIQNLTYCSFAVNENGITLRDMDRDRKTLVDIVLQSTNFNEYKSCKDIFMNLSTDQLYRLVRNVKKKDSIELRVNSENPNDLTIVTIPKENTFRTTSSLKIQNSQRIELDLSTGYGKPVTVNSIEFSKTCKDLLNIAPAITVESKGINEIKLSGNADQPTFPHSENLRT